MELNILMKAGLTESQAKGYLALIENGDLSPAGLAKITGETRTNAYAIADKLVGYGLAIKKDGQKAIYTANHPSALEALAERRRKLLVKNEQDVKQGLSPLIDLFYAHNELPGTRTLQGIDGIKEVHDDILSTQKNTYLIRSVADSVVLGSDYFHDYRIKRAKLGIKTYALTPVTEHALKRSRSGEDEINLFHRVFLPGEAYTAPVDINVYGDKVAFISFGETQMATIINSPTIAKAMRQIMILLRKHIKLSNK